MNTVNSDYNNIEGTTEIISLNPNIVTSEVWAAYIHVSISCLCVQQLLFDVQMLKQKKMYIGTCTFIVHVFRLT